MHQYLRSQRARRNWLQKRTAIVKETERKAELMYDEEESVYVTSAGQEPEETTFIASTSSTPANLSSARSGMDDSGIFED